MEEKDYSEYTLTEAQKYRLRRRGNQDVLLDYFSNSASFDKVYDQMQEIVDRYFAYRDTLRVTKDILKQSLYAMICPPVFADETDSKALKHYYSYLRDLQKEYLELLEFCFDERFYPSLLGNRHPAERFYLYRDLHGYPVTIERTETVQFTSHYRTGHVVPYGMTTEEVIRRRSNPVSVTDGLREFAERYHAEPKELAAQENFKKRAADRPALGVYDLYYRRYVARKKVRQIKEDEFKKWRYEAMRLRDECEAGKLTVEEYERWMEDYFPNRKKRVGKNSEGS